MEMFILHQVHMVGEEEERCTASGSLSYFCPEWGSTGASLRGQAPPPQLVSGQPAGKIGAREKKKEVPVSDKDYGSHGQKWPLSASIDTHGYPWTKRCTQWYICGHIYGDPGGHTCTVCSYALSLIHLACHIPSRNDCLTPSRGCKTVLELYCLFHS